MSNQHVEDETIKDRVQQNQPITIDVIRKSLLEREEAGFGGPLKLKFMRVPVERRRKLCESCYHVNDYPVLNPGSGSYWFSEPTIKGRFCDECMLTQREL